MYIYIYIFTLGIWCRAERDWVLGGARSSESPKLGETGGTGQPPVVDLIRQKLGIAAPATGALFAPFSLKKMEKQSQASMVGSGSRHWLQNYWSWLIWILFANSAITLYSFSFQCLNFCNVYIFISELIHFHLIYANILVLPIYFYFYQYLCLLSAFYFWVKHLCCRFFYFS